MQTIMTPADYVKTGRVALRRGMLARPVSLAKWTPGPLKGNWK